MNRIIYIISLLSCLGLFLPGQSDVYAQSADFDSLVNHIATLERSNQIKELKKAANYFKESSLANSKHFALEREILVEESKDDSLIADNYNLLGNIYQESRLYTQAKNYYEKSLAIFQEIKNYNGCATETHNLGLLYFNRNDTLMSIDYFKQSIEARLNTGNSRRIGDGYTTMGEIYLRFGYFEKSISNLTRGIEYYAEEKSYHRKFDCLAYLTDNFMRIDPERAYTWIVQMQDLYQADTSHSGFDLKQINFRLGQYYLKIGNIDTATSYFDRVIGTDLGYTDEYNYIDTYRELSDSLMKNGNLNKSLIYAELTRSLHRASRNSVLTKTIRSYKTRLDMRALEEEVKRTEDLNRAILRRIKAEKPINISIMVILVLLATLLFLLINNFIKIRKAQKILDIKNKELEIANIKTLENKENSLKIRENKNKFFSIISDKLFNPFALLNSKLKVIAYESHSNFNRENLIRSIGEALNLAESVEKSLKRILLWSKLQRGQYLVQKVNINVNDYLHDFLPDLIKITIKKNIKLRYDIDNSLTIMYDQKSLGSLLRIIVENSVDNSENLSEIIIRANGNSSRSIISITDSGKGIRKSIRNSIFDIYRPDTPDNNKIDRLGLGLPLAYLIAELNNSTLSFETKERRGTTFHIKISNEKTGNNI